MFVKAKICENLLRIFRACAEFQPPAKPAPAELTTYRARSIRPVAKRSTIRITPPPSRAGSRGSRRLDRSAKRGGGRARARHAAEREDGRRADRAPRCPPRRCRAG